MLPVSYVLNCVLFLPSCSTCAHREPRNPRYLQPSCNLVFGMERPISPHGVIVFFFPSPSPSPSPGKKNRVYHRDINLLFGPGPRGSFSGDVCVWMWMCYPVPRDVYRWTKTDLVLSAREVGVYHSSLHAGVYLPCQPSQLAISDPSAAGANRMQQERPQHVGSRQTPTSWGTK